MSEPQAGEIYQHYKRGTTYKIMCIGVIEATKEPCVVYEALDPEAEQRFWVRPMTDFCAQVEHEGRALPRFTRITDASKDV